MDSGKLDVEKNGKPVEDDPLLTQRSPRAANREGSNSNRDSGIQDGEFTEQQLRLPEKKVDDANGVKGSPWTWPNKRSSVDSEQSVKTNDSEAFDPKDELCGWGPFSPQMCQRFRNPRWVLVFLSMAGVCQVSRVQMNIS